MNGIGTNHAQQNGTCDPQLLRMDALNVRSLLESPPSRSTFFAGLIGLVVSLLVLSGCQRQTGPAGAASAPNTAENTTGTGDSGGGNGLDGKFFESYAVNPLMTPEWKNSVAPIIENLSKNADSYSVRYSNFLLYFAKSKTWYVAPVKLASLSKKKIGVEFIQDPMQQHALQTAAEIWIEKSFWDRADQKARGLGLLHEVVMAVYLSQFMTTHEMCLTWGLASKAECGQEKARAGMKPKAKRPLNEIDYANIRSMTTWLSEHGATTSDAAAVHREFMRNGFDSRFEPALFIEGQENAPLEFKVPEYFRRLSDASIGRRIPKFCQIARGDRAETAACDLSLTLDESGPGPAVFEIRIDIAAIPGFSEKRTLRARTKLEGYWGKDGIVQSYARDIPALQSSEPGYLQMVGTALVDAQQTTVGTDVFPICLYLSKDGFSVRAIRSSSVRVTRAGIEKNGKIEVDYIAPAPDVREHIQLVDTPLEEGLFLSIEQVTGPRGSLTLQTSR